GGKPAWVDVLVRTKFWKTCEAHKGVARGEGCVFCLDCYEVTCPRCGHGDKPGHRAIKIRRYNLRSVVLAADLQDLGIDVPKIQQFILNSQNILYLRPVKRSKKFRPRSGARRCSTCQCYLHGEERSYKFCSLVCEGNQDVSPDDFSGPEAEERMRNLHKNMKSPASEHGNEPRALDNLPGTSEVAPVANLGHVENNTFRRRLRKQGVPNRAPFF
ncbi:hypothetical protein SETIT_9G484400v2, partial [Setaria italica]